jgi:hypothetical protein
MSKAAAIETQAAVHRVPASVAAKERIAQHAPCQVKTDRLRFASSSFPERNQKREAFVWLAVRSR